MKNPIFIQKQIDSTNSNDVTIAISSVAHASSLSGRDKQMLKAFVQNRQEIYNDEGDDLGVPKDAVYESHSPVIVDISKNIWRAFARQRHTQLIVSHCSCSHWKIRVKASDVEKALEQQQTLCEVASGVERCHYLKLRTS